MGLVIDVIVQLNPGNQSKFSDLVARLAIALPSPEMSVVG